MNGRIKEDETPEERLAAVAKSLMVQMCETFRKTGAGPRAPDYADFRESFRPFLKKELILARIDEARHLLSETLTERMRRLTLELAECERQLPDVYQL